MTSHDAHSFASYLLPGGPPAEGGQTMTGLWQEIRQLVDALQQTLLNPEQVQLLGRLNQHLHQLQQTMLPPSREEPLQEESAAPAPNPTPLHLLLAEDNLLTQKLMVRMLELRGHRVDVVDNGEKAVAAVTRAHYDLLLMDVRMPVMDGMEACRAIRQLEKQLGKKRLPILAVTVLTSEEDRLLAREVGMDGFHSKPVKADLLFAEMERVLHSIDPLPPPTKMASRAGRLDTLDHLSRSVDGDVQLVREVVSLFFSQSQEQLPKLRHAITLGEANEVMELAHSLKGAAGAFGPSRIHELAYQLEMAGRTAHLDSAPTLLTELEQEIQDTNIALHNALEKEEFHV